MTKNDHYHYSKLFCIIPNHSKLFNFSFDLIPIDSVHKVENKCQIFWNFFFQINDSPKLKNCEFQLSNLLTFPRDWPIDGGRAHHAVCAGR